jgi:hypothetical protein
MAAEPQTAAGIEAKARARKKLARRLAPFAVAIIVLELMLMASYAAQADDRPCIGCVSASAPESPAAPSTF